MTESYTPSKLLIGGVLVEGRGSLEVINPSTGQCFAICGRADEGQALAAVASAKSAFSPWARTPLRQRASLIEALADAIEYRLTEFATLLTREQGKPLSQATAEITGAIANLRYYGSLALDPKILRDTESDRIVEHRGPLGVVVAITPWNYPISLLSMKLAPALLAGNTVVAKPAPTTPLTTLLLGEVASDILPPGVLNVIVDQNDLGQLLTSHPDVAKVSFTGSTATGKRVMVSAAGTLKRLTLELGGNDAAIVLDDVDVEAVAPRLVNTAIDAFGRVDIIVNNAGILRDAMVHKMEPSDFDAVIDVHLRGAFYVSRAAVEHFRAQNSGCFLHMTSGAGLVGNIGQANYMAAKMGIVGLSRGLSQDLQRYNIRSNCISPFAKTRMLEGGRLSDDQRAARDLKIASWNPEAVGTLAVALASDASESISGQIFGARGGEVFVYSQPRPIRSVHKDGGWTPEGLARVLPKFTSVFAPLSEMGMTWDSVDAP